MAFVIEDYGWANFCEAAKVNCKFPDGGRKLFTWLLRDMPYFLGIHNSRQFLNNVTVVSRDKTSTLNSFLSYEIHRAKELRFAYSLIIYTKQGKQIVTKL